MKTVNKVLLVVGAVLTVASFTPAAADHQSWTMVPGYWVTLPSGRPIAGPFNENDTCLRVRHYIDSQVTDVLSASCAYYGNVVITIK